MDISKTLKSFMPHLVAAKMAFDASKYKLPDTKRTEYAHSRLTKKQIKARKKAKIVKNSRRINRMKHH